MLPVFGARISDLDLLVFRLELMHPPLNLTQSLGANIQIIFQDTEVPIAERMVDNKILRVPVYGFDRCRKQEDNSPGLVAVGLEAVVHRSPVFLMI